MTAGGRVALAAGEGPASSAGPQSSEMGATRGAAPSSPRPPGEPAAILSTLRQAGEGRPRPSRIANEDTDSRKTGRSKGDIVASPGHSAWVRTSIGPWEPESLEGTPRHNSDSAPPGSGQAERPR